MEMIASNIQRDKSSFNGVRGSLLFSLASSSEGQFSGSSCLTASSPNYNPNIQLPVLIDAVSPSFHLEKW
jgi:hypothetical protein